MNFHLSIHYLDVFASLKVQIGSSVFSRLKEVLGSTSLTRIYTKMGHQEKPLYLYHEALRQLNVGQDEDIDVSDVNPKVFLDSIKSGYKYTIDDFCIDRHTAQGRSGPKCTTLQFAATGAQVANLHSTTFFDRLERAELTRAL